MKNLVSENYYLRFFFILALALIASYVSLTFRMNTRGIVTDEDFETLSCASDIHVLDINSIEAFYKSESEDHGFSSQICSFELAFNGSLEDRVLLFNFSQKLLEFPLVGRRDIAQHFYKKIIKANPDDALSEYLRDFKIENRK